jgi:hypothetical protein
VDVLESSTTDVGKDTTVWALWDIRAPKSQATFGRERDSGENAFLAPSPPASSDERAGAQAVMWEVVDEFIDEFLGK